MSGTRRFVRCSGGLDRGARLMEERRRVGSGDHAVGQELTERRDPPTFRRRLRHQHDRAGSIGQLAGVAGGDGSLGIECRSQPTEAGHRRLRTHALVVLDDGWVAAAGGRRDRDDLVGEPALLDRRRSPLVRESGKGILVLPAQRTRRVTLGAEAHQAGVECAPQAIGDDRVPQFRVAVAVSGARPLGEVRGIGHRLDAGSDHDVGFSRGDHLVGEVDRVQSGEADLVDVDGGDVHRDPGLHRRLPRGHLSLAGHQHLADDDMFDLVTSDRRAIECRTDGDGAEVDGRHRREST